MKFISKYQNYRVVLKSGISGNRETGQQPIPGEFVKFERGIVDVKDESKIEKLKNHSRYGKDFVSDEDKEMGEISSNSQFLKRTKEQEPKHNITEMEYGQPSSKNQDRKVDLGKKDEELIKSMAKSIANEIVKEKLPEEVEKEIARREEEKSETPQNNPETEEQEEESSEKKESVKSESKKNKTNSKKKK